ncbi:AlkA N-terminal domain-containing protein [Ferrimonas balearica]|uniref:AlkA N-terminal domain-containing protein n=1 Tax=Ferrimonas balearica TaxID=44012 RepID=UPI001F3C4311|nr:AlkA N-terminal domain-containing protein [Ferrimonas balearica]MBY6094099.1 helix-turn-helix domain-containing protein [Ferrimonas balearica]
MESHQYRQARLARDPRFDGRFFVAVRTTGIYCRPICPATAPKEDNVRYFDTALAASQAGYRPCLRCRPDSAPGSPAWRGSDTTLTRAIRLIDEGALVDGTIPALATRLGITPRYLNKLFQTRLGTSAKQYALHQQLMLAKQLLHDTALPMTEVAAAAGFGSVRRFNDCFASQLKLTPGQIRRSAAGQSSDLTLFLSYRPPYAWTPLRGFLAHRAIEGLEWHGEDHYGRTLWTDEGQLAHFTARHQPERHGFAVTLTVPPGQPVLALVGRIRRLLDLDADIATIDAHLASIPGLATMLTPGLRLPGIADPFEAGVRAILGQQVSVAAARNLVQKVVDRLGPKQGERRGFPTPQRLAEDSLAWLGMPDSRRQTLRRFAAHVAQHGQQEDPYQWLALKGIGPWTVEYIRMRGLSEPDRWLGTDLGIKKALAQQGLEANPDAAAPWRSYLTFQLWNRL